MMLTVPEAAAQRGVTRFSIHRWLASGLPFEWVRGKRMIDSGRLAAFVPRSVGNPNFRPLATSERKSSAVRQTRSPRRR
jgi:hypothetical protein